MSQILIWVTHHEGIYWGEGKIPSMFWLNGTSLHFFSYSVIIVAFLPKFTPLVALYKRWGFIVSDYNTRVLCKGFVCVPIKLNPSKIGINVNNI